MQARCGYSLVYADGFRHVAALPMCFGLTLCAQICMPLISKKKTTPIYSTADMLHKKKNNCCMLSSAIQIFSH